MDILHLKYFQMVARTQHISRAARELYISQPALSSSIAKLENELGVQLFDRLGRQVLLNEAGKAFYKKVNVILDTLEEGRQEALDISQSQNNIISIGSVTSVTFSTPLKRFCQQYPDFVFRLGETKYFVMLEQLKNFQVDFCYTCTPINLPEVNCVHLLTQKLFVAVPTGHKFANRHTIRLEEVKDERFIALISDNDYSRLVREAFAQVGITPKVSCEVFQTGLIASMISADMGISILPFLFEEHKGIVFLEISDPVCTHDLYLVWMKNRHLSNACQFFLHYILDQFKDYPRGKTALLQGNPT